MSQIEHVLPSRDKLGEGPLWNVDEQALYWVDLKDYSYSRFDPLSGNYEKVHVGTTIGVMARRAAGGLVMATKQGFAFWDTRNRTLTPVANPEAAKPTLRFNDGAVDCRGRFWAGTISDVGEPGFVGSLYRLDPDGTAHRMLSDMGIPNGLGWSPDHTVMYITDSARRAISAYDFDEESGSISHGRVLISTTQTSYDPDGLAMDSEGYIWSACWNGAQIVRYDPQGVIERVVEVPALRPTSCAFGGPDLDELYITSSRADLSEEELARYPLSGDLFRLKTVIRGAPTYPFAG